MAGIGFRLERLAREGGLGTNVAVLFSGTVLSTGHWLMTILGIGLTMLAARNEMQPDQLETLLLLVVYAFAIASLVTSTCLVPSIRRFSNSLFDMRADLAPAQFFSASFLSAGLSLVISFLVLGLIFGLPIHLVLAGSAFCTLVSLLWSAAAFCSATQAVGPALAAYGLGTALALALAVMSVGAFTTVDAVIWSYTAGLSVTLGFLNAFLYREFPFPIANPLGEFAAQLRSIRREVTLAVGSLASALAVWSSTLVIWSSDYGHTAEIGLRYSPLYDAAFFFGLLAIIPGLTLLTVFFETELFRGLRAHLSLIESHGTITELDASEAEFATGTLKSMGRLMIMQMIVAVFMLAILPWAVEANLLQHRQQPLAKIIALGTVMHVAVLACSLTLIYLDATRQYALVHCVFLGATVLATIALLPFGERMFGLGYLIGTTAAAIFGTITVARLLGQLNAFLFSSALTRSVDRPGDLRRRGTTRGAASS